MSAHGRFVLGGSVIVGTLTDADVVWWLGVHVDGQPEDSEDYALDTRDGWKFIPDDDDDSDIALAVVRFAEAVVRLVTTERKRSSESKPYIGGDAK